MRRAASALLTALVLASPAPAGAVSHATLDSLLRRHVRAERVDYLTLRDEGGARLDAYLDRMAKVEATALPAAERLAFEIDLYNASMIRAVCDRYREGWTPADDEFAVFKAPIVRMRTGRVALDHLEHELIRARTKDARVHTALVCAARSCPPLLARAWTAAMLEADLDRQMRAFVRDSSRNRVDRAARTLMLSRLFDWYAADFSGAASVAAFVGRWRGEDLSGFPVSFLEYDWSLNLAAPRSGLWRTVSASRVAVRDSPGGAAGARTLSRGEVVREREARGAFVRITLPGGGEGWIERSALRPWRPPS